MSGKPSLSQQVMSATLWNTLLLPGRILVGILASVVFYQQLSPEQVSLVFLITSLATTLGLYADLGIERTLPPFLPQLEGECGREGVSALLRRVIGLKLLVLLGLIAALFAAGRPLGQALAERQRDAATRLEARASALQEQDEAARLRSQGQASRAVAGQIEAQGWLFLSAVALLLVLGALFDVDMQVLTAYFRQRAWNLITITNSLLRPALVTGFVLLGLGVGGVVLGLVITPALAVLLARSQARRARREAGADSGSCVLPPGLLLRFARFASVNYLLQITTWLYDLELVVFLAAATLGLSETALLGFAYKLAKDTLGYLWTPLTGVMTPLLARVRGREDPLALREAHASLTRLIWLLLIPSGTGVCLLLPRLLGTLYPKYASTAELAVVFLSFGLLEAALAVPHNVLMVHERYRAVVLSRFVTAFSIPLVQLLLPRHGLLGVALAVGLVRVAASLVTVIEAVKLFRLALPWAFGLRVALATLAFSVVLLPILNAIPTGSAALGVADRARALASLGALSVLGAAVFLLALRRLGGLEPNDRRRLLELRLPGRDLLARVV